MNNLDDSNRETYRRDLLAELVHERYPEIPSREIYARPMPLARVLVRSRDGRRRIAERQRALRENWRSAGQRAA